MPRRDQAWLNAYEAKQRGRHPEMLKKSKAVEEEDTLQDDIVEYCRAKGWICLRNPMNEENRRMPGEPDFDIAADGGNRIWVECKSKTGKLRPKQAEFMAWAEKLGHKVHLVFNLEQFHALMLDLTKEVWE